MRFPILRSLAAATLAVALLAAPALAGQVRIDAGTGGGFAFSPTTVTLNLGDHVVWVWVQAGHTVTSGDPNATGCDPAGDGTFATNLMNKTSSVHPAFSWKSNITSSGLLYYCVPHCPPMVGTLIINASGVPVSNFRITEVQFSAAGGLDLIEITNFGAAAGDLGRYRFAAGGDTATVPMDSFVVPASGRVVVHVNASGTQSAPNNLYLPSLNDLPSVGSLGLYAPNTASGQTAVTNVTQIIDYVEWGAPTQANESIAVAAQLWSTGDFVGFGGVATRSIEFCGTASDHGAVHWSEVSTPNFGSNGNCLTPTVRNTWGRLKAIYR